MVAGGEHVEYGNRALRCEFREPLVGAGAKADCRNVARKHAAGVGQRLAAADLKLIGAKHDRVTAELGDADLKRDTGTG